MESLVSHLMDTNHAPDPLQLVAIQKEIDACAAAANELQIERQRLNEARRKVDVKLWELDANIQRCQQLLSCLRRVPPEILGEIFKASLDPHDMVHIPLLVINVCLVCKAWRDAAIGTPGLWNKLQLASKIRGRPIRFAKVSTWLSRSGALPQYLHLHMPLACGILKSHPTTCDMLESGLVRFLTDGPTLQQLSLFVGSPPCLVWLAKHMKNNSPTAPRPWDSLQSLDITVTHSVAQVSHMGYLGELISNLPRVATLHLQEIGDYQYASIPSNLPMLADFFDKLTAIQSTGWSLSWMKTLLPLCKNLHSLTMDSVAQVSEDVGHEPGQLIVLQHLHLFRIAVSAYMGEARVLPLLFRMPSLKELEIDFDEGGGTEMGDHHDLCAELAQFLQASNAYLSHLQMSYISITPGGLRGLLLKVPSLTHLTFHDVTFDAATFDSPTSLVPTAPDSLFLPCLEVLECFRLPKEFRHARVCNYFARRVLSGSLSAVLKRLTMELATGGDPRDAATSVGMLRNAGADVLIYARRARGY